MQSVYVIGHGMGLGGSANRVGVMKGGSPTVERLTSHENLIACSPSTSEPPGWNMLYFAWVSVCLTWKTWCCNDIETISALLAFCKGNPTVTGGFPSQRSRNADFFSVLLVQTNWRTNNWHAGDLKCHGTHVTSLQSFAWIVFVHWQEQFFTM